MTYDNKSMRWSQTMTLKHIGQVSDITFDDLFASAVTRSNKCQQQMFELSSLSERNML